VDPSRDYIKRVVGLPGERVRIRGGDLYINGSIARKPWDVQEALWRHSVGSDKVQAWRAADPQAWRLADGLFEVDCRDAQDPQYLRLDREVDAYDAAELRRMQIPLPPPPTCDAMVEFLLEPRAQGGAVLVALDTTLTVGIVEPIDQWLVLLPLSAEDAQPELFRSGELAAQGEPCGFAVGRASRIQVCHVDRSIIVRVDGQEVLRREYELPAKLGALRELERRVGVALGCKGGHVVFRQPGISVDLHLTRFPDTHAIYEPFALGEDEYFTLGDHNINSNDSRAWGAVSRDAIVGKATRIVWPSGRERPIR